MLSFLQRLRLKLTPGWVPIQYSGFYDVPLGIIAIHNGRKYFFERLFNDDLDEYEDFYRVYDVTGVEFTEDVSIWNKLRLSPRELLCTVPVSQMAFDRSKRKWIEVSVFENIPQPRRLAL